MVGNLTAVENGDPITGKEKEDELLSKIEGLFNISKKKHGEVENWADDNLKYYDGKHWEERKRPTYKSDVVINLMFMGVETVTPIMTDRQPILRVIPADDRAESKEQSEKVEKMFKYHWRRLRMPLLTPKIVRNMLLYRDCVVKWYWDYFANDVSCEIVKPHHFYIDPNATNIDDAEYCFMAVPRNKKYIKERFPEKASQINEAWLGEEDEPETKNENKMLLKEFWGFVENDGKYEMRVITYIGDVMLENKSNPYYDSAGTLSEEGKSIQQENKVLGMEADLSEHKSYFNYFKQPRFPFIKFETFNIGNEFYSRTSLPEQLKTLQQSINKRKAQIDDNANMLGNGQWVIGKSSGVDLDLMTNQPGLIIEANDVSQVEKIPGTPLPGFIHEDLLHSQMTFDNIFGNHGITRGERTSTKTATEASLLREADQGRIALLIRSFEAGIEELGRAWLHLMKMFYTETHYGTILGKKEAIEYVEMTRDDIQDGCELMVKAGSTTPVDRLAQRQESLEMFNTGALDPVALYEKLGDIEEPEETARRLDLWNKGMLFPENMPPQPGQEGLQAGGEIPPDLPPTLGTPGGIPSNLPETLP